MTRRSWLRLKPLLPALGWGVLVLVALGMPGSVISRTIYPAIRHIDKLIHIILFMVTGCLLAHGFFHQDTATRWHRHHLLWAFLLGTLYGALTEWLQHILFSGRHGSLLDMLADATGTALGIALFRGWHTALRRRTRARAR
jgi:VanZ family protein